MTVPGWVQDAIFYQIFPDRFADGDPTNDPPNLQAWGAPPTLHGFQGGDLRGVIQRFDYLLDLGVNALYLNPIFQATSNHRYNTTDYYRIDPRLGGEDDLRALLSLAHRHRVRVVLDGVFNHCGRGFFAFNDLLENEAHSPYRDWFHVRRFPLDAYGPGQAENYLAWWKVKSLPKFNTDNPEVRRYLLGVARHWVEQGIDGWRLDVPNEIDDDSFWAEFREQVKGANPEAYLVGEIWEADPRWVGPGHFDGLINYPLRRSLLALVADGSLKASEFGRQVDRLFQLYPREHMYAHYLTLGSHDTERVRTLCGGDLRKVRLMLLFIFCFPGAPGIYYGDEIGILGGKDPDCRRAFPWNEAAWDQELRNFVRHLVHLRRTMAVLRHGEYAPLLADDRTGIFAFARKKGRASAAVVLNTAGATHAATLSVDGLGWEDGEAVVDAVRGRTRWVTDGFLRLRLGPYEGAVLHRQGS
jgi:cyclomaltodextrinase